MCLIGIIPSHRSVDPVKFTVSLDAIPGEVIELLGE